MPERLFEVLSYDPETGVFTWLIDKSQRVRAGHRAGCRNAKGYRYIEVDGRAYRENRLAWFMMRGEWPLGEVDHENGIKDDNRWVNLRHATKSQNLANSKVHKNNKLGIKGVHVNGGSFRAQIKKDGKVLHLGSYSNADEAHAAYIRAAKALHGSFARGG